MVNLEILLQPRQHVKKQRHHFADKGLCSQSYSFSSSDVWMWELDHKEGWAPKDWCFWTVVLKKTPESPLDSQEIKPVNLKEINPEYSLEGLMLRLKLQYFGHPMWRVDSLEIPWCWERLKAKGEEGCRGWDGWMHQWLHRHEFEQTLGDSEGQGSLVCCSPWSRKELDTT